MMHGKAYCLWVTIIYGLISAASTSAPSQAIVTPHKRICSTVLTACDNPGPMLFAPAAHKLYSSSSEGIISLRLPNGKKFKREIALELPEQPISALAFDAQADTMYVGYGARVGEVNLIDDCQMLQGSDDPEPEWAKPNDAIEAYTNDRFLSVLSPISALCVASDKRLLFSASADRICRWSITNKRLDALEAQVSPTLAMQIYSDALFTMHANGDLQSVPLERDAAQHNGTFDGKAMRVAAFDEPEKCLYTISHEGRLYTLDIRAQKVTHITAVKNAGMPTALATKNHGVFVADDQGMIKFYDMRRVGAVGTICSKENAVRQLWYDRVAHNLLSLDATGTIKRYWME